MKVRVAKRAQDAVNKLQPKIGRQVAGKIAMLRTNPYPQDCKKLHGGDGALRVTSGEYRIVYHVITEKNPDTGEDEKLLYITAVGKRNDGEVYR